jgi:hypothetical protein
MVLEAQPISPACGRQAKQPAAAGISIVFLMYYFTKRPAAAGISIVFPSCFPLLFHEAQRSLFLLYFNYISPARRGGYFVFLLYK